MFPCCCGNNTINSQNTLTVFVFNDKQYIIQYESEIESINWAFTKIIDDSLGLCKNVKQTFPFSEIPLCFFCSGNLSNVQSIPRILDYMIHYTRVKIIVFSFCQFISHILKITIIVVFLIVW